MNLGWIRFAYWKLFSKPAPNRLVYRLIDRNRFTSITEIGLSDGERAQRMIAFARRHHPPDQVRYAGLDPFEGRPSSLPGLTLKAAFRLLSPTGVQVRLVPGDLLAGLVRSANTLTKTDLIVIDAEIDRAALQPAWFYFPRMLHERSLVLLGTPGERQGFQQFSYGQVVELARIAASAVRRAG